ncbi:MAG: amidase family protein, partial [Planctomycetota bacterium]
GVYASHLAVWERLAASDAEIALILEDDVVFHDDFREAVETALRARGMILRDVLETTFGDCDAILLPVFPDAVPTIEELDLSDKPELLPALARVLLYTRAINYLALPALTLPYARGGGEMPNGSQFVGRPFREDQLMTLAATYERAVSPEIAKI